MIHFIDGGVTAPQGFTANGILCHIKSSRKTNDTALIFSDTPCTAAGVFTQNRVQAEPVKLTRKHLADGRAQAIIANSGNANACTGAQGAANALRMAQAVSKKLGIQTEDVVVCSTGVIGQQLPIEKIESNIERLAGGLCKQGHEEARIAIMTTDTRCKECAVQTEIGGKVVRLGTQAKGSGMIHINLGTMLGFITTDAAISSTMLEKALRRSVAGTYNCVSIDGDTSTNDTLVILANGRAGNAEIAGEGADFDTFCAALDALNTQMAKKIAADGEGAGRLIECTVKGAVDVPTARALAKSVISSTLVKAAFFGRDANWGRVLCALGYSGEYFDPAKCSVYFASVKGAARYFDETSVTDITGIVNGSFTSSARSIKVCDHGVPLDFDEALAKEILSEEALGILVELEDGDALGTAWGCDLTYEYVKINGDYRT